MLNDAFYERKISQTMHEKKALQVGLELKMLQETGEFEGYASVFDIVDNHRDVVTRGAFRRSIEQGGTDVKLLWQHRMEEPIGVISELYEDSYGLYIKGRLLLDVARGREAYSLLKSGAVRGLSIGYRPTKYRHDAQTGVRKLMQVELVEISLVTEPANEAAEVNEVKQMDNSTELAALARALEYALEVSSR